MLEVTQKIEPKHKECHTPRAMIIVSQVAAASLDHAGLITAKSLYISEDHTRPGGISTMI